MTALRVAYRRLLLQLAARDLTGAMTLGETAAELADLAAAALEAALAIARARLAPQAGQGRLAVIAMGKCGGRELNYVSDVDVIFVAAPAGGASEDAALRAATQLAAAMISVCSEPAAEGPLFPVDANLRPEGRDGPLVRTLASHRAYYERWAKTWEFQALLKARPVAGDAELGRDYVAGAGAHGLAGGPARALRRGRAGDAAPGARQPARRSGGPGAQARARAACATSSSRSSCSSWCTAGPTRRCGSGPPWTRWPRWPRAATSGRPDAAGLASAYRFLRGVEHLLQLYQLRRTHTLPEDPAVLRRIGRAMHLGGGAGPRADPAAELTAQWRQHASQVRQLHEKLFYRPLLEAVARLPGEDVRLTPQAAQARLEALGYADPAGALRHIAALTAGVSRKAAIQRTLLPVMLGWFADAAQPDAGLLAFRQVSEALGDSPWYLRLLRDDTRVARRMARLLASSRYAAGLLLRAPDAVAMLADDAQLAPRPAQALQAEAAAATRRHQDAADAVAAALALRRRELLRTAAADVLGLSDIEQTGEALSTVAAVTVAAALEVAVRTVEQETGPTAHPDGRAGHGQVRRARDGLRERRRRDVRA